MNVPLEQSVDRITKESPQLPGISVVGFRVGNFKFKFGYFVVHGEFRELVVQVDGSYVPSTLITWFHVSMVSISQCVKREQKYVERLRSHEYRSHGKIDRRECGGKRQGGDGTHSR